MGPELDQNVEESRFGPNDRDPSCKATAQSENDRNPLHACKRFACWAILRTQPFGKASAKCQ